MPVVTHRADTPHACRPDEITPAVETGMISNYRQLLRGPFVPERTAISFLHHDFLLLI
jgi:hypothetical protein